ncbi:aspartate-semialdehyde dehydrogenase [Natronoglycomyces albus]|uniref:Aspartate-semialdehyde dehydrogenase n=1 Tax=Natronoglycomyces albus TaxID=2811108 RepID=A0A895XN56_9ACTN|nr:aspartate-semialdehyde dehydrogenase [Natronoglycomyces albus]QSB04829.1 aspartate-semialdehyde dehydrogenase [Natronoglycomyces albus]
MSKPNVAIVGATGVVGSIMRNLLAEDRDRWGKISLLASPRSAGKELKVGDETIVVQALSAEAFDGVDIAHFDLPDEVSAEWVPVAAAKGVVVIDKSAHFRMDPDVPLVCPESNPQDVSHRPKNIIANANCTTLALIPSLAALNEAFGLKEMRVASYQAASGSGKEGLEALYEQAGKVAGLTGLGTVGHEVREVLGEDFNAPFGAPLVMNVVPKVGGWKDGGWTSEELKVRNESRKILGLPDLAVSSTCVRVPVAIGHSQAVNATFAKDVTVEAAHEVLRNAPGVDVVDDPENMVFPMPIDSVGAKGTQIGRIRQSLDFPRSLDFFVVADNIMKGAAENSHQTAVLVAQELAKK